MSAPAADPLFDVTGKVFLITGVSSGLGAAMTCELLSRGAKVVGASRSPLKPSCSESKDFHFEQMDLRDDAARSRLISTCVERFGRLDVLINNAGSSLEKALAKTALSDIEAVFSVNTFAAVDLSQKAFVIMQQQGGGSIINISSVLTQTGMSGLGAYAASKAALDRFTDAMALEWARYGVRVNTIAPGWFRTEMTKNRLDKGLEGVLRSRTPQRKVGDCEEIVGSVVFLSSDSSKFVTGACIHVDGGYRLSN